MKLRDTDDTTCSHAAALTAASATAGKKTWRTILLALGTAGMLGGVSTASASSGGQSDDDGGAHLVHQAKGCFSWGPPAPPAFA
jgi:hypothetical protein